MRSPEKKFPHRRKKWIPPDYEWLEYHYIILTKTARQIGVEVGTTHNTVARWLDRMGIPRRTQQNRWGAAPIKPNGLQRKALQRRARKVMSDANIPRQCEICGCEEKDKRLIVHHKDGDKANNSLENLQLLCFHCHGLVHLEEKKLQRA